jgi:hypothetical protein
LTLIDKAEADGDDSNGEEVAERVIAKADLNALGGEIFGQEVNQNMSARKLFGLLARASGAYHVE